MNTESKEMKKKDGKIKFSESVKGKSIPAKGISEDNGQKRINFNKNKSTVNNTPDGIKQKKVRVDQADFNSTEHKFLGINYHEYQVDELHQKAREMEIDGRSKMNKEELIDALFETHSKEEIYEVATNADISGRSNMSKNELITALRNNAKNTPRKNQNNSNQRNPSNASKDASTTAFYKRTKEELYEVAKEKDIDGRSTMDKIELLEALYRDHTKEEIYEMAQNEDIKGRSSMSKSELIKELQTA